ncbi:UDP-N-acetylmuramoyl-tripeptide--D-alanyl-D-alanine ligase [Streptococcus thoraltensis]|uniref:UDP-N-acetylmuramoyl-tripeptide--D-alanyl-D- alanine ligase n=1 Tax=Streptococcus thoraltensis TaxID=55085 RepID=UPI000375F06A|nr:UDP-N-acetylmuramoyl-tripeptide--D-alanyl-D-alanine ligase [Streptococcus thoraltensis]MDY4761645.1 UDP-N-acetylmuramoyl-tripeptide--D-alanyl-D-alanine ligase [Streptococcus thoraltensis]
MKLRLHEVAKVVGAKNDITEFEDVDLSQIEFDSRKITVGDLFLPLKGARDGHDFIEIAFENGALATFSEKVVEGHPYILVDDCLTAFQTLASYYIERSRVDVIAVTGSNGKTTTKDMIAQLLATTYNTYKTQGNYNNEIGLPYTVLHMPDNTEKLVLEMGQDHLGDIKLLSEIARPHIGVVTLVAEAHLEFFGSRDKIAEGKMQITDGIDSDGILIAPADVIINPYLPENQTTIRFGADEDIFITELQEAKESLSFKTNFLEESVFLPITGKYNATNAMVAAYVAKLLMVTDQDIYQAFRNLELTKNRTEWKKAANGADILSDVYNANPTAMKLILETFSSIPKNEGGRKLAVLADMKELGDASIALHESVIESLSPESLDMLFFYGDDIRSLSDLAIEKFPENQVFFFEKSADKDDFEALSEAILDNLEKNDQILLKGSNSMKLANIVASLETN